MNMRKNIGLRLSQARKAKGLTQEQLAELASFSVSEISRIETGRAETPLTTLQKLCDVLQIGLDFLLYDCFRIKLVLRILPFSRSWNCSHLHRKKSRRFALKLSSKFTSCRIKI